MPDEYIKREDLFVLAIDYSGHGEWEEAVPVKAIRNIPSADVAEARHGKWEDRKGLYEVGYKCSLCGFFSLTRTNFCPNCGSYNGGEHGI